MKKLTYVSIIVFLISVIIALALSCKPSKRTRQINTLENRVQRLEDQNKYLVRRINHIETLYCISLPSDDSLSNDLPPPK